LVLKAAVLTTFATHQPPLLFTKEDKFVHKRQTFQLSKQCTRAILETMRVQSQIARFVSAEMARDQRHRDDFSQRVTHKCN